MSLKYFARVSPSNLKSIQTTINSELSQHGLRVLARPTPADPADWKGKGTMKYGLCDATAGYYRLYTVTAEANRVRIDMTVEQLRAVRRRLVKRFRAIDVDAILNAGFVPRIIGAAE
jgi:hypothetical protein